MEKVSQKESPPKGTYRTGPGFNMLDSFWGIVLTVVKDRLC